MKRRSQNEYLHWREKTFSSKYKVSFTEPKINVLLATNHFSYNKRLTMIFVNKNVVGYFAVYNKPCILYRRDILMRWSVLRAPTFKVRKITTSTTNTTRDHLYYVHVGTQSRFMLGTQSCITLVLKAFLCRYTQSLFM